MTATTQTESNIQGTTDLGSMPCGLGASPVSPFQEAYLAPSPFIECGSCRESDRPLWWGICGWCGADEEDVVEAA